VHNVFKRESLRQIDLAKRLQRFLKHTINIFKHRNVFVLIISELVYDELCRFSEVILIRLCFRWNVYGADAHWNLKELKSAQATHEIVEGHRMRTAGLYSSVSGKVEKA